MLVNVLKAAAVFAACAASASVLPKRQACDSITQRVPWTNLTSEEKTAYINADLCLIDAPSTTGFEGAVTRWDDLQWPHVHQTTYVHGVVRDNRLSILLDTVE